MTSKPREGSLVFLDACCLINLFATGRIEEILEVLPYRFATSELVADEEVLAIGAAAASHAAISPRDLRKVTILSISNDAEESEFVRFAGELDDGEASVYALAKIRGGMVATDDRKALRLLTQPSVDVPVLQTPELLHQWAKRAMVSHADIREVLTNVGNRGRFHPRNDAPFYQWWAKHLRR